MMKPYLCISANIKSVFILFASLTWAGDKHFAFPSALRSPKLRCAVLSCSNPLGPIRMPAELGSA